MSPASDQWPVSRTATCTTRPPMAKSPTRTQRSISSTAWVICALPGGGVRRRGSGQLDLGSGCRAIQHQRSARPIGSRSPAGCTRRAAMGAAERRGAQFEPLNRWREPSLSLDIQHRSGPIVVTIEYGSAEEDVLEFSPLMAERRRIRRRDGARHWHLLRDLSEPDLLSAMIRPPGSTICGRPSGSPRQMPSSTD